MMYRYSVRYYILLALCIILTYMNMRHEFVMLIYLTVEIQTPTGSSIVYIPSPFNLSFAHIAPNPVFYYFFKALLKHGFCSNMC